MTSLHRCVCTNAQPRKQSTHTSPNTRSASVWEGIQHERERACSEEDRCSRNRNQHTGREGRTGKTERRTRHAAKQPDDPATNAAQHLFVLRTCTRQAGISEKSILRAVPSRKLKPKVKPTAPLRKSDMSEPQISRMETKPSFFLDLP